MQDLHSGHEDAKFAQLLFEEMKNWRIPHYGCGDEQDLTKSEKGQYFTVRNPTLVNGSYVAYKIVGRDRFGTFEGRRRFNEFFLIRQALVQHWPGIYVPAVPAKKAIGNKELAFIMERRYYLERFLKQLSQMEFLINSDSFRVFTRPEFTGNTVDIEK